MSLELRTTETPDGPSLALSGELDIGSAPQVEAMLRRIEERKPPQLILDLSALQFIDSSGLRVVLTADKRAREEGRSLALVPGPPSVHRVFEVTRVAERLRFIPAAARG